MQKNREWAWLATQQHALETLEDCLLQAPVLMHPGNSKPYILHTDASDVGVGATLSQLDAEVLPRLGACRSRKLNQEQSVYPVHETEMLALVDALDDWRHYMLGAEIHIFTDNSALRHLQNTARHSARQVWWLEKLQLYPSLMIAQIPWKTNTAADALSRNPSLNEEVIEIGKPTPLDLAFLVAVDISTSHSIYIQPSVFEPLSAEPAPSW